MRKTLLAIVLTAAAIVPASANSLYRPYYGGSAWDQAARQFTYTYNRYYAPRVPAPVGRYLGVRPYGAPVNYGVYRGDRF